MKDIEKAHKKILKFKREAQTCLDAEEMLAGSDNVNTLREVREQADDLLGKVRRLENTRLVKLGKTLAMFDTMPIPVEGLNQPDVILQKI